MFEHNTGNAADVDGDAIGPEVKNKYLDNHLAVLCFCCTCMPTANSLENSIVESKNSLPTRCSNTRQPESST